MDNEGSNSLRSVDPARTALQELRRNKSLSPEERSLLRNDIIGQDRTGIAISAMLFNVKDTTAGEQERAIDRLIVLGFAQYVLFGPRVLPTLTDAQRKRIIDYVAGKREKGGDDACSILRSPTWGSLTGDERTKILQTIAIAGQSRIFHTSLVAEIVKGLSEEERRIVFSTPSSLNTSVH